MERREAKRIKEPTYYYYSKWKLKDGRCRRVRQLGLQANDAADVSQEVFRAAAGGIGGFQRDQPGGSFRSWPWTITMAETAHDRSPGRSSVAAENPLTAILSTR